MQLVERDEELAVLEAAIEATAEQERGQLVVVSGEAGLGKTALIHAAIAGTSLRCLVGRCDDLAIPVPLGPFLEIAHSVGSNLSNDAVESRRHMTSLLASEPTIAVIENLHGAMQPTRQPCSAPTSPSPAVRWPRSSPGHWGSDPRPGRITFLSR